VKEYTDKAQEGRKNIPAVIQRLARYQHFDVYDLASVLQTSTLGARQWLMRTTTQFPGMFMPHPRFADNWTVRASMEPIVFPPVTGVWNDGIPAEVVTNLQEIASQHPPC
jgi:hypothetical protein